MENKEIKALSSEDLKSKVASLEKDLNQLRYSHAISNIANPMQIRDLRRAIARIKTELQARVDKSISAKIEKGELTNFNAREFQATTKLDIPVKLAKVKRIISQAQSKNK